MVQSQKPLRDKAFRSAKAFSLVSVSFVKLSGSVRCRMGRPLPVKRPMTKLTRVDGERFCAKSKFGNRRNTLCISRFSNWRVGAKDPSATAGDFVIGRFYDGGGHEPLNSAAAITACVRWFPRQESTRENSLLPSRRCDSQNKGSGLWQANRINIALYCHYREWDFFCSPSRNRFVHWMGRLDTHIDLVLFVQQKRPAFPLRRVESRSIIIAVWICSIIVEAKKGGITPYLSNSDLVHQTLFPRRETQSNLVTLIVYRTPNQLSTQK